MCDITNDTSVGVQQMLSVIIKTLCAYHELLFSQIYVSMYNYILYCFWYKALLWHVLIIILDQDQMKLALPSRKNISVLKNTNALKLV